MGIYDKFKTSKKLETEGIIQEFDGFRVTIARAGGSNQKYNAAMEHINAKHGRAIANNALSNDKAHALVLNAYVSTIILDWETLVDGEWQRGIEGENGELLEFSPENVAKVLNDLPDLFNDIRETSTMPRLYLQSILDGAVKN